jgi:WD40 repeat protein
MNVAIALAAPLVAIGVNVFDLDDPKRGHQGRIRIWNFETQESRDVWKSKSGFGALAISPMGDRVAVWDVEHHPLQVIDSRTREIQWRDASVDFRFGPLAFSPDGQCLAAGVDREIRTYKSNSGKLMRRCTGRMGSTVSIAFAADSSRIVTGGAYPTIRVWGVREAREDLEIPLNFPPGRDESVESVAFAPDSQTVLAFIPKFEKAGWWDRISGQRSVDSFDHVGTLILRHSLSEKVTKTVLDSNLLFTKACFCFGVSELAMCPEMSRNVEIWRY